MIKRRRISLLRGRRARRVGLWSGCALLALIVLGCIFIPIFWSYGPDTIVAVPFLKPSWAHPFGTDSVGRDVFLRTFAGGRVDLVVAALAVGFSLMVGSLIGTLAGSTKRGWLDSLLMRIADAVIAFPFIILILALVVVFGSARKLGPLPAGLPATLIAFFIAGWAYYARLARSEALARRDSDYIEAARQLGYSQPRIVVRHLSRGVVQVTGAYAVGDAILFVVVLASLSFLGAGIQPPTAEWGSIMYEGRAFLETSWWITVAPGVVLAFTGLALSLVADSLLAPPEKGER